MPVSTETLNEDIKDLSEDLHKVEMSIRGKISRVEVSLRSDIARVEISLEGDINRLDVSLTEIKTTLRDAIRVATWEIILIARTLITSAVTVVWWAFKINTKAEALESHFDRLEALNMKLLRQTRPLPK